MVVFRWFSCLSQGVQSLHSPSALPPLRCCIQRNFSSPSLQNAPLQLTKPQIPQSLNAPAFVPVRRCLPTFKLTISSQGIRHKHICSSLRELYGVPLRSYFNKSEVVKNVVLYKNTGVTFFRLIGAFACGQLVFWSYTTYASYTSMRDARMVEVIKYGPEGAPPELKNWKSWSGIQLALASDKWRYGMTALCVGAGLTIFLGAYMYCKRSVSSLILLKGGNKVRIETFGLLGLRSSMTVPLSHLSCQHSRHAVSAQLPIKVKGHLFHYVLDKQGKFLNGPLFDYTAGMKRVFT